MATKKQIRAAIVTAYLEGASQASLADKYEMSRGAIIRILDEVGARTQRRLAEQETEQAVLHERIVEPLDAQRAALQTSGHICPQVERGLADLEYHRPIVGYTGGVRLPDGAVEAGAAVAVRWPDGTRTLETVVTGEAHALVVRINYCGLEVDIPVSRLTIARAPRGRAT